MNQKHSILNLFVCLLAVLLVVFATSVVVSAGEPAAEKTDAAFLAANPELMFARRYADTVAKKAEVTFLDANPELMFARRYVAAEAAEKAATLANPTLYVRHYVVVSAGEPAEKTEATLLAANPELMFARRYIAAEAAKRAAAFSACYEGHH
jgi:hypothetical protein